MSGIQPSPGPPALARPRAWQPAPATRACRALSWHGLQRHVRPHGGDTGPDFTNPRGGAARVEDGARTPGTRQSETGRPRFGSAIAASLRAPRLLAPRLGRASTWTPRPPVFPTSSRFLGRPSGRHPTGLAIPAPGTSLAPPTLEVSARQGARQERWHAPRCAQAHGRDIPAADLAPARPAAHIRAGPPGGGARPCR